MSTGTRIGAAFAFALAVIMGLAIGFYVSTQRLLEANRAVEHTHLVMEKLEHVLSVHKDAETGQRGYVLTGEARYLEPYNTAAVQIHGEIESLQRLTADNPEQQASLAKVQSLSDAELAELRQTIELRKTSGLDAALQVIRTDRGKQLMDELRGAVAQMQTRERTRLDTRSNAAGASGHRTILAVAIWTPLSLLILTGLAMLVTRKVRFSGAVAPPGAAGATWGSIAVRYAFAAAAVAIAGVLRWWLSQAFGPLPAFITFYPAVLLVASVAGGGPGILASVLAALVADYAFLPPYGSLPVASTNDFVALCIFTCTNLFLCVLAERLRRSRRAEAVAEQKELLEVTLASIGDAVIVTDARGAVSFLNGEAERLTGWKLAEAQGQPLPAVFEIINEQSRQPVENPVDKVLRLGTVVGLANHTILLARDGRETPIDDSGAPVREADGTVHGVVLVFRDFSEQKTAEKALRESEERFRTVFETMTEGFALNEILLDEAGRPCDFRYLEVNAAFEHHTGLKAADTVGRTLLELFPKAEREWIERYGQVALTGAPAHFEGAFGPLGRWFDVSAFRTEQGRFAVIFMDVTDRKRKEEDLRKLNRTLRALSNSNAAFMRAADETRYLQEVCGNVVKDCGHLMAWVGYARHDNGQAVEVVAHAGAEQGYLHTAQISWADTERGRGPTGTAIRTGKVSICNNMLTESRFGPWREEAVKCGFASSLSLPLCAGGPAFGALTIYSSEPAPFSEEEVSLLSELAGDLAHGITAIRLREAHAQATEALRQSQEQYHTLFSTLIEGFCIIEMIFDASERAIDFRFVEINPAFEAQTGLHDAQGKRMRELVPEHEEHWFEMYGKVALTGESVRFVSEARGLNRWYDVSAYRVGGQDSRRVAILFNDITERKLVEEDLMAAKVSAEQAKGAAESASRAKDHFLAVLSHELRNPLNPVLATTAMLRNDPRFDDDTREQLEVIYRNAELEARLIDDLLDVTRIERGKIELDRHPVELCTIIRRAAEVCMPDIEARKLEFGVDFGADAPYYVHADAARLQQVFWNLLKNAVKFTPVGGCVGVRCRKDREGFVVAEVNDSGVGMEPEALGRIFNAFEQAERSITRQFGGLGLGLAISHALVGMHGGTIEAHSMGRGKGATFTVRLPLLSAEAAIPAAPADPQALSPGAEMRPARILLVEDHGDTVRVMRRLLTANGHEVQTASDITTGLKLALEQPFDLLLSDLGLPDGSGLDLMRNLRARGSTLPGIALSGYGQEKDVQQSRAAGFRAHLTKPVSLSKLEEAIAKVLAEARRSAGHPENKD
jgi:PAS domain S-box-containing protein